MVECSGAALPSASAKTSMSRPTADSCARARSAVGLARVAGGKVRPCLALKGSAAERDLEATLVREDD